MNDPDPACHFFVVKDNKKFKPSCSEYSKNNMSKVVRSNVFLMLYDFWMNNRTLEGLDFPTYLSPHLNSNIRERRNVLRILGSDIKLLKNVPSAIEVITLIHCWIEFCLMNFKMILTHTANQNEAFSFEILPKFRFY